MAAGGHVWYTKIFQILQQVVQLMLVIEKYNYVANMQFTKIKQQISMLKNVLNTLVMNSMTSDVENSKK